MTEELKLAAPVELGPFVLHDLLGRGGMGDVWRGVHVRQDIDVAVKVLSEDYSDSPGFLDAFRAEIEAVARLHHPGIVMVFDHGVITEAAAETSGGVLRAGHPYLVMEIASGGTLQSMGPPAEWSILRDILLGVLDALAHAHARGVIHRDVKPANVLVCDAGDSRPGLKLSDFGLAAAGDRRQAERLVGTPAFMAPEQCDGRWRDHGPWTDLYAFGCLAYALASGRLPFQDSNPMQIVLQQFAEDPPPLNAIVAVPQGFEGWIRKLMAKAPGERFRWAADAAHALLMLGEPVSLAPPVPRPQEPEDRLAASGMTYHAWESKTYLELPHQGQPVGDFGERRVTEVGVKPASLDSAAPLPPTWRRPAGQAIVAQSMQLVGVGLGLFGLRTIPHIGREPEQTLLWDHLAEVHELGEPRVAVITGEPGTGKTRLAFNVAQRAHEMGAAKFLHGTHGASIGGPGEGLPRMLADHLNLIGLERRHIRKRLGLLWKDLPADLDIDAVTEAISPATPRDLLLGARPIRFASPDERYATILRLLQHLALERPLIIVLDDVQWGHDALEFVTHVLSANHRVQALFLLTVRRDIVDEHPLARQQLEALSNYDETSMVPVSPLPDHEHGALVRELLCLEGDLAVTVETRTMGNPLFAVQLVDDWVQRGVLEVGKTGFKLRAGETAPVPDDIHHLWRARLEKLTESESPESVAALELAAALGVEVRTDEWAAVAGNADKPRADLLSALYSAGLAHRRRDGWAFAHNMFRESLERSLRETGQWSELNRQCAAMIERLYPADQTGRAERMGRHLLAANELERAIDLLLTGANERFSISEVRVALSLLDSRAAALEQLEVEAKDIRWAAGWTLRARVLRLRMQVDEGLIWARRAVAAARSTNHKPELADALLAEARLLKEQDLTLSLPQFSEARDVYEDVGDLSGVAACDWGIGVVDLNQGRVEEASDRLRRLLELSDLPQMLVADAAFHLAGVARRLGHLDEAEDRLRRAWVTYEEMGSRAGVSYCLNGLGEILRERGDLSQAESRYREAISLSAASGLEPIIPRLNLTLLLLERESFQEARQIADTALDAALRVQASGLVAVTCAILLPCLAHSGEWDDFDRSLQLVQENMEFVDPDVAKVAELSGRLALDAGQDERARHVLALALQQWKGVGRDENAAVVAALLDQAP